MGVNFNEGGMDMKKKALLLMLALMFVSTNAVSQVSCGQPAEEIDCENFTTTFANHLSNDRIWYDDYYHPDYGPEYGYLTKGANDEVCDSVGNYCNFTADYTLHRFPLDDPDTYYLGSCEE